MPSPSRLDRVDVEVVERLRRRPSARLVRLVDGDVRRRCATRTGRCRVGIVDLLDDALLDLAVRRAAERREVGVARWSVDGEQRGVPRRDQELVDVAREAVARGDVRDHVVRVVGDDVAAVADALRGLAAPPGEDRPAAVALDAEVGDAVRVERAEPDDVAGVVEDQRPRLVDLLLRRDEDVPGRRLVRACDDVHRRRTQVRPRDEVLRRGGAARAAVRGLAAAPRRPSSDERAARARRARRASLGIVEPEEADGARAGVRADDRAERRRDVDLRLRPKVGDERAQRLLALRRIRVRDADAQVRRVAACSR